MYLVLATIDFERPAITQSLTHHCKSKSWKFKPGFAGLAWPDTKATEGDAPELRERRKVSRCYYQQHARMRWPTVFRTNS
ncbi:unnamed protein product [Cochlearia groenlandica]